MKRGFIALSIIELIVVLAIILIIAKIYLTPLQQQKETSPQSIPEQAIERSQEVVCRNNLSQIMALISAYETTVGSYPEALSDIKEITPDLSRCPIDDSPYLYDSKTGTVHCPTHTNL